MPTAISKSIKVKANGTTYNTPVILKDGAPVELTNATEESNYITWSNIDYNKNGTSVSGLNFANPFVIIANRQVNPLIAAIPVDDDRHDYIVFDSGYRIKIKRQNFIWISLFDSLGNNVGNYSYTPNANYQTLVTNSDFCVITFFEYNEKYGITFAEKSASAGIGFINSWCPATGNALNQSITPSYVLIAWDQIAGNSGQYRCNLTKIKNESIGDISGANYGANSDITRVTQASDIVPYVRNMNYNSPVKIAYSGVNWLTAEIQPDTGLLTNQVKCVFKFYIKNVSETTPFYTLTEYFFAGNGDHHYLSFVHDDEQQAAAFLPVGFDKALTSSPYYWGNVSPSESEMCLLWLWLQASGTPSPDPHPTGPYDNGSTDNGGTGGNPIPQDDIHTPNIPVLGAMASGMFTVYCPTDTQLGQIAQYLWSDNFIDNVKKYFNNVSDNIIAFYVLPLEPENLLTKNFKIGNLENASITGVKYLNSRFISVDMGSVTVESRWDTYLDFSPFTRFNCYLPGVGIVALDSDDIMSPANQDGSLPTLTGSTISLKYVIDLFTGVLVAYVMINGQIRYQFPGRMGYSIPLTGQNYTAMGQGFVTAMAGLASTIATGGTAAPFTAGATAAGIVNAMKPDVYRSGNLSGDASMLSLKTPILIRTRPNKPAIENQELFSGAPSYKIDTIGSFGGFTQVVEAHIEGISCTDAERSEIMQLLRSGVLI